MISLEYNYIFKNNFLFQFVEGFKLHAYKQDIKMVANYLLLLYSSQLIKARKDIYTSPGCQSTKMCLLSEDVARKQLLLACGHFKALLTFTLVYF
jgi:hypothetical protein